MCTAVTYKTKDFYFGRTLDYEFSYHEQVTITPRNYPLRYRHTDGADNHFAFVGMAYIVDNYPLYYDATNEKGLSMAGLNFVGNAHYNEPVQNSINVASFELIPWVLSQCSCTEQARALLQKTNIVITAFSEQLQPSPLHWIIADRDCTITVEPMADGLKIYDNPVGVLTNNPPFNEQLTNLNNYMALSNKEPKNTFSKALSLYPYSRGMGALGLPGDLSSQSRFVRAAFTRLNSVSGDSEGESVNQFFHILGSVEQQRGCCDVGNNEFEITIYTSCCNADKGIYYYTTYVNQAVTAVDMHRENLSSADLIPYPLLKHEQITWQN
ncbi:MAG: choloylglycine hydrolase [Clostridia bacterium]|nr:choloylglycine hydrolase [Clostridia bacterium]